MKYFRIFERSHYYLNKESYITALFHRNKTATSNQWCTHWLIGINTSSLLKTFLSISTLAITELYELSLIEEYKNELSATMFSCRSRYLKKWLIIWSFSLFLVHAFILLCFTNTFIIAFCPNKILFIVLNFETSNRGMASFCTNTSILSSLK